MSQSDLIVNEVRKLAQLLARLMGLKAKGQAEEYQQLFNKTLQDEYNAELEEIVNSTEQDFKDKLMKAGFSAAKLNALSQMLFVLAEPFTPSRETESILNKVLIIFDLLETGHHYESFENLEKRSSIYNFFKKMKSLKWKLLSSKYIHKGKWATLRIDTCEMPDGTIVDDYYVLEYGTWVNGVAITEEGKVLMVKQYRHAADIISLEIPGGVVDEGEDPQQALRRELLEETGYQFDDFELLCVICPNPSTGNNRAYSYLAKGGKKVQEQALDDHEDIIVEEYTIDEIKQFLAENKIMQAMHCTALFYGLMKLEEL